MEMWVGGDESTYVIAEQGLYSKREKRLYGENSCSDNFSSLIATKTGLRAVMLSVLLAFPCIFFPPQAVHPGRG